MLPVAVWPEPERVDDVVLIVEDNCDDVFLIKEAIKLQDLVVRLVVMEDGEKAIAWIKANDVSTSRVTPAAVVLDINLPKLKGPEVLAFARASESLRNTPVIIFTSSNSYQDRALTQKYLFTKFLKKSVDLDEYVKIGEMLKDIVRPPPLQSRL